jgi:hypothetical protein
MSGQPLGGEAERCQEPAHGVGLRHGAEDPPRAAAAAQTRDRALGAFGLVATLLPLRWVFGGSRGRSGALARLQDREVNHCVESRFRPGFRGLTGLQLSESASHADSGEHDRAIAPSALSRLKHGFECAPR